MRARCPSGRKPGGHFAHYGCCRSIRASQDRFACLYQCANKKEEEVPCPATSARNAADAGCSRRARTSSAAAAGRRRFPARRSAKSAGHRSAQTVAGSTLSGRAERLRVGTRRKEQAGWQLLVKARLSWAAGCFHARCPLCRRAGESRTQGRSTGRGHAGRCRRAARFAGSGSAWCCAG